MKLTLIRHGLTRWNSENRILGSTNKKLSKVGVMKATELKEKLKDKNYDICYMSPLIRCVETAIILIGDRVLTKSDKRLIERNMGEFEGEDFSKYDHDKYWDYDLNCGDSGVEPIKDLFDRCRDFLDDIGDYDNVMIVSHSAILRCLYHLIVGTELKGYLGDKKIPNLEVIELEYEKKH